MNPELQTDGEEKGSEMDLAGSAAGSAGRIAPTVGDNGDAADLSSQIGPEGPADRQFLVLEEGPSASGGGVGDLGGVSGPKTPDLSPKSPTTQHDGPDPGQEAVSPTSGGVGDLGNVPQSQKPRVILPGEGRPDSVFATEMGQALSKSNELFHRDDGVVQIRTLEFDDGVRYLGFHTLKPVEAVTEVECRVEVGILRDQKEFVPMSMSLQTANKLINAPQFKRTLPSIRRILDIKIPVKWEGKIAYLSSGYDARLHAYVNPEAPEISPLPLAEAKAVMRELIGEFCFTDQQSVTNAVAYLLTPLCRGLMGFRARFPLFIFAGNRPRAGKDFLAGLAGVLYEALWVEDPPVSSNEEEMRKKITTALKHGRRSMHFGNCEGLIHSAVLKQAVTTSVLRDRFLGGNREAPLRNELLISVSGNSDRLTYDEDLAARSRVVRLSFSEEDPNSRSYRKPALHTWALEHRSRILSAFAGLVEHWLVAGQPPAPTDFTSFPEWRNVVGGIVHVAGLGDPCAPDLGEELIGGDQVTADMKTLFLLGHTAFQENWISKKEIYDLLKTHTDLELFGYFGVIGKHSTQVQLGRKLLAFKGRELSGIRLLVHVEKGRTERAKYRFTKQLSPEVEINHVGALLGIDTADTRGATESNPEEPVRASGNNVSQP